MLVGVAGEEIQINACHAEPHFLIERQLTKAGIAGADPQGDAALRAGFIDGKGEKLFAEGLALVFVLHGDVLDFPSFVAKECEDDHADDHAIRFHHEDV